LVLESSAFGNPARLVNLFCPNAQGDLLESSPHSNIFDQRRIQIELDRLDGFPVDCVELDPIGIDLLVPPALNLTEARILG
jgi:hypothetical protein